MNPFAHSPPQTRFRSALELLVQSHEYVRELGCESWDFAVELTGLQAEGLSSNDLRWLLAKKLVAQAVEISPGSGHRRSFHFCQNWGFPVGTCFVLTEAGAHWAKQLLDSEVFSKSVASTNGGQAPKKIEARDLLPNWDRTRRTLCFRQQIVKRYKVPAPNQELILAVFEEETWPYRIDDPLPLANPIDPKRRLHDTINALNRHQCCPVLRFFGDGQGEGICWEPLEGPAA